MAENKKSFVAYCDWIESFEELSDEEAGRLAKHLFRYVNDKQPEAPDKLTKMCFIPIKQSLKRDLEKWSNNKDERSNNGRIGNLKRWNKELYKKVSDGEISLDEAEKIAKRRKTSGGDNNSRTRSHPIANIAVSDSVSVSDSVTNKPLTPKGESFDFQIYIDTLNKIFGKNHKVITKTLKSKVNARLKQGYTKKNFWIAMQNVKNNEYHKESNYQYVNPLFFTQEDKLEKYGDKLREKDTGNKEFFLHD